jgi:hypothetical protein
LPAEREHAALFRHGLHHGDEFLLVLEQRFSRLAILLAFVRIAQSVLIQFAGGLQLLILRHCQALPRLYKKQPARGIIVPSIVRVSADSRHRSASIYSYCAPFSFTADRTIAP